MSLSSAPMSFTRLSLEQSQTLKPKVDSSLWGKEGFGFASLVDIANPLQHIPGVSTAYRQLTGDKPASGAKIIGSTLYGGLYGLALAAGDSAVKSLSGKSTEDHLLGAIGLGEAEPLRQDPDAAMALFTKPAANKLETAARLAEIDAANAPIEPKVTGDKDIAKRMNDALSKYAILLQERQQSQNRP